MCTSPLQHTSSNENTYKGVSGGYLKMSVTGREFFGLVLRYNTNFEKRVILSYNLNFFQTKILLPDVNYI